MAEVKKGKKGKKGKKVETVKPETVETVKPGTAAPKKGMKRLFWVYPTTSPNPPNVYGVQTLKGDDGFFADVDEERFEVEIGRKGKRFLSEEEVLTQS